MEMAVCFCSSCCTTGALSKASRWVAGLPFLPKDQAYILHLMARLCSMIAWNGLIFRDGVVSLGGHGQKIHFPFLAHATRKWLSKGAG
jgi:hypothetical protein